MAAVPGGLIRRKAIIKRFLRGGAISPETAKTPEEVGSFKGAGFFYSRLESRGVLISCGGNRYYVDIPASVRDLKRIIVNTLIIFGAIIAAAVAIASVSTAGPGWVTIAGIVIAILLIASLIVSNRK